MTNNLSIVQFTRSQRTAKLGGVIIPVLVAEASDLGFRPGQSMPATLWVQDVEGKHTKLQFSFVGVEMTNDGDIAGWRYRALGGTEVLVIND